MRTACMVLAFIQAVSADAAVGPAAPDPPWMAKLPKGVRDMLKDPTLNKSSIPWTDFVPAGKLNTTEPAPPMLAAERVPPTGTLGLAHLALAFSAGMALTVAILAVARYLPNAVRTSRSIIRLRLGRADEESLTSAILSANERDAGVRTGAYATI